MAGEADADRQRGAKRVTRVGGWLLPGLKRWRIRRGITQQQLADRVGVRLQYVSRVEQGRSCNRAVAQKMADALEVDLRELRGGPDEGDDPGTGSGEASLGDSGEGPPNSPLSSTRYLHQAYLKVLLKREFGSAYLVLDEGALEEHVEDLPVEEVVKVIFRRRRELEFVEEVLASDDDLHPQVHIFLEGLVRERPGEDIRVLAARRSREPSEEGRQRLTQAMRELL